MNSGDTAWVLASSALVLLMTPGLAFFYAGMVRRKNAAATIMHSFMCIALVGVVWVLWGYSLAFGDDVGGGLLGGLEHLGLAGVSAVAADGENISEQTFMIFQAMFAIITPALITGAFAERMKFSSFVIFTVLWVTIVYAPVAHWVWHSDGWLFQLGALDFAGGTVVHMNAGFAALAAAWVIFGRRKGYGTDSMPPHNVPFVVLGAALLWFGWFGFNAGSALAANASAVNAFVVTNTAAAAAILGWLGAEWLRGGKPSAVGAASGAVAGLVAITPAAGFVGPMPAIAIGVGAGVFCYFAVQFINHLRIDDSLAVFGVHGIGGVWGGLATGLFAGVGTAAGVFTSDVSMGTQVGYQLIGMGATALWAFAVTAIILLALKYTIGVQVTEEEEEIGLDITQHGQASYSEV
jgi:Amt family ammonium transporter